MNNAKRHIKHFLSVVHDPHGGVLGKDNEIHTWEARLDTLNNLTNLFGVIHHFLISMETGHGILKDTYSDSICFVQVISSGSEQGRESDGKRPS